MPRVLLIFLLGTALYLTPSAPACAKTVKVGIFDFKPLCHYLEGELEKPAEDQGLFVSFLQIVASRESWKIEFVPGTLADGMQRLSSGEIDLFAAAAYSKDGAAHYDFTRETIISTWAQVYALDKTHVQSWFDLASRSIGVVRDDPYNQELRAIMKRFDIPCRFIEFEDYKGIFNAMENGWVEIGIVDRLYGLLEEKAHNVERTSIVFAPVELRFAAPKGRSAELIAALDYHLSSMKKNPASVYHKLMSEILGKNDEFKTRRLMAWSLLGALAVAGFLAAMSLLLRMQIRKKTAQLSENYEKLKAEIAMRRSAESAFQENRRRFETLFEFAPEPILVLTPEGRIIDCNKATEELTGYSKAALLQMKAMDLVPSGAPVATKEIVAEKIASGFSSEILWKRKNGEVFTARISAKFLELGSEKNILMIARDLTWTKKMEEEMIKVQKLESVGVLAGGIAHDFNNILTAIMGNLSLAKMKIDPGDPSRERIEIAEQACTRATDLTRQLLTFARGGAPVKETASIRGVIEESCRFALRGSNVGFELDFAENVWQAEIDVGQVSQVVNNIMINAGQAMPDGGIIKLSVRNVVIDDSAEIPLPPGRYVKVAIHDQGTGIPKENLSKVFDPYFTTKPTGNGLGLASCYSIVRKHGGHITLESEVGVGTTLHVYLPASAAIVQKPHRTELQPLFGKGKILVMDDEDAIRDMLERLLGELKYEVASVGDGSEAVRVYEEAQKTGSPFDLVIMDLTIPGGMGGREAIARLHEIDPMVRAIVSSGYSDNSIMSEYGKYGFSGVIRKPYKAMELSRIIDAVISGGKRESEMASPARAA